MGCQFYQTENLGEFLFVEGLRFQFSGDVYSLAACLVVCRPALADTWEINFISKFLFSHILCFYWFQFPAKVSPLSSRLEPGCGG